MAKRVRWKSQPWSRCPDVVAGVGACGGPSGGFLSRKTSRQPPAAAAPTSSIHRAHISLLQRHASACVFGSESCMWCLSPLEHRVNHAARVGSPGWSQTRKPRSQGWITQASQPATPRAQGWLSHECSQNHTRQTRLILIHAIFFSGEKYRLLHNAWERLAHISGLELKITKTSLQLLLKLL